MRGRNVGAALVSEADCKTIVGSNTISQDAMQFERCFARRLVYAVYCAKRWISRFGMIMLFDANNREEDPAHLLGAGPPS